MAKKTILCSLNVKNKKEITRVVGTGILAPKAQGLFHFATLSQVNHVLVLERNNQVTILSEIPSYVLAQLEGDTDVPFQPVVDQQPISLEKQENGKPAFYLSWEEVEAKDKGELQKWFTDNPAEGFSLPKNKNAAATKEIVHAFLSEQFEDHVAPAPVEDETLFSDAE